MARDSGVWSALEQRLAGDGKFIDFCDSEQNGYDCFFIAARSALDGLGFALPTGFTVPYWRAQCVRFMCANRSDLQFDGGDFAEFLETPWECWVSEPVVVAALSVLAGFFGVNFEVAAFVARGTDFRAGLDHTAQSWPRGAHANVAVLELAFNPERHWAAVRRCPGPGNLAPPVLALAVDLRCLSGEPDTWVMSESYRQERPADYREWLGHLVVVHCGAGATLPVGCALADAYSRADERAAAVVCTEAALVAAKLIEAETRLVVRAREEARVREAGVVLAAATPHPRPHTQRPRPLPPTPPPCPHAARRRPRACCGRGGDCWGRAGGCWTTRST